MEAAIQFSRKMALADEEMIEAKAISRGAVDMLSPQSMLHACMHMQIIHVHSPAVSGWERRCISGTGTRHIWEHQLFEAITKVLGPARQ